MGEEVKIGNYSNGNSTCARVEDRVLELVVGLPTADDLTPLSQSLIPPELASAFRISPEPSRTMLDVSRASQNTLSSLLDGGKGGAFQALNSSNKFNLFHDKTAGTITTGTLENVIMDVDDTDLTREGSDSRKTRREGGSAEEADSATNNDYYNNGNENGGDDGSARTLKRPRLVWTPQLHKRFVDVVAHLGIKNAVPKTIMQLMNVEGLTRENVASHLQKYRLYLKRMQGLSTEGPSSSDHLFSSTPVPHSLQESGGGTVNGNGHLNGSGNMSGNAYGNGIGNGHIAIPFPMQYLPAPSAHMVPFPMIPMPGPTPGVLYDPNHHHHQYAMMQQPMDWSGNKFGSVVPQHYYHVAPNDK